MNHISGGIGSRFEGCVGLPAGSTPTGNLPGTFAGGGCFGGHGGTVGGFVTGGHVVGAALGGRSAAAAVAAAAGGAHTMTTNDGWGKSGGLGARAACGQVGQAPKTILGVAGGSRETFGIVSSMGGFSCRDKSK